MSQADEYAPWWCGSLDSMEQGTAGTRALYLCLVHRQDGKAVTTLLLLALHQGFMQDKIIASHTCFGEHMDVNC